MFLSLRIVGGVKTAAQLNAMLAAEMVRHQPVCPQQHPDPKNVDGPGRADQGSDGAHRDRRVVRSQAACDLHHRQTKDQ